MCYGDENILLLHNIACRRALIEYITFGGSESPIRRRRKGVKSKVK